MKVLFDVGHPAHVHLFRNAIGELRSQGHNVLVTSREKDITTDLLDAYGITHVPISAKGDSTLSLVSEWLGREARMLLVARLFDPDVIVARLNPPAAHVARALGCRSIIFDDSEKAHLPAYITYPFADAVCTPAMFDSRRLGAKQYRYQGFHELAYLHPNWFEPDPDALAEAGVDVDEPYFVLRFVAWGAHHDVGQRGLSFEAKRELIEYLAERGNVYITSEDELPAEFEQYRLPVAPHLVHDLLSYADLYVGDSQTMATEAAVLGTPAVRSNSFAGDGDMSNFAELQERYGLLYSTGDEDDALAKVTELVSNEETKSEWNRRRERLLEEKIDVTDYMLDMITREGAA